MKKNREKNRGLVIIIIMQEKYNDKKFRKVEKKGRINEHLKNFLRIIIFGRIN